jgi:VIT1/CCC1 family predicted Fe2+/Mn2+ transporter
MRVKKTIRKGLGFGLTSGIITTLGLMIGLHASTNSRLAVIGGILTIAFADALSDALGIHMSEESVNKGKKEKGIWESTFSTFFSKLFFALTFLIPVLLFPLGTAIIISIFWGLFLITIFSYNIAKREKNKTSLVITEHLIITIVVIILSKIIGNLIARFFG